jgi:hypothetical protein
LIHILGAVGKVPIQPVFFTQWLFSPAIHPVPNHAVLVVDGNPHVSRIELLRCVRFGLWAVGSDLGEGHDEIVTAHVNLLFAKGSDRYVSVAELRRLDVEYRRTTPGVKGCGSGSGSAGIDA